MPITTRNKFIKIFDAKFNRPDLPINCADDRHVIWEGEKSYSPRAKCKWFVCVTPIDFGPGRISKRDFWEWINATLSKKIVCYSSDSLNKEEWWGFEDKKDAIVWLLKWSK